MPGAGPVPGLQGEGSGPGGLGAAALVVLRASAVGLDRVWQLVAGRCDSQVFRTCFVLGIVLDNFIWGPISQVALVSREGK